MGIPAVIFDLDGTLVDSEPLYYEAGRRVLAGQGVPGFTWQDHVGFIGVSTEETLAALRERHGLRPTVPELLAELDRIYLAAAGTSVRVFPRVRALAESLRAAGHPLAVASGSSREAIAAVLAGTGLAGYFAHTVSAQEVADGKPAPDVLLETARRLGVAPGDCVVVEDAPAGVLAAARAGMRCVAVPSARADDPAFRTAGLVFAGGQREFDERTAFDWING